MPWYEWTRDEPFRDTRNDRQITNGEVVELPANVADPAYGFVEAEAPAPDSEPEGTEANADAEAETEICGVEMTDGSICDRPAERCPYHG